MRKAFTLVELSIVLVILGLLVGGVLAGQSLIKAAELRAISTEYTNYKIALTAFRDKYFSLPGDMPNAVRYWGFQAGNADDGVNTTCAALTHTSPSTDQRTCNGNGDGLISNANSGTNMHERTRIWQHMANAGLIEGQYTGVRGAAANAHAVPGQNVPKSRFNGGGWYMLGFPVGYSHATAYPLNYGNTLIIGGATTNTIPMNPLLTPQESYNIDMKMDDGKPHTGFISTRTYNSNFTPNCAASTNTDYDLVRNTPECHLIFITGY